MANKRTASESFDDWASAHSVRLRYLFQNLPLGCENIVSILTRARKLATASRALPHGTARTHYAFVNGNDAPHDFLLDRFEREEILRKHVRETPGLWDIHENGGERWRLALDIDAKSSMMQSVDGVFYPLRKSVLTMVEVGDQIRKNLSPLLDLRLYRTSLPMIVASVTNKFENGVAVPFKAHIVLPGLVGNAQMVNAFSRRFERMLPDSIVDWEPAIQGHMRMVGSRKGESGGVHLPLGVWVAARKPRMSFWRVDTQVQLARFIDEWQGAFDEDNVWDAFYIREKHHMNKKTSVAMPTDSNREMITHNCEQPPCIVRIVMALFSNDEMFDASEPTYEVFLSQKRNTPTITICFQGQSEVFAACPCCKESHRLSMRSWTVVCYVKTLENNIRGNSFYMKLSCVNSKKTGFTLSSESTLLFTRTLRPVLNDYLDTAVIQRNEWTNNTTLNITADEFGKMVSVMGYYRGLPRHGYQDFKTGVPIGFHVLNLTMMRKNQTVPVDNWDDFDHHMKRLVGFDWTKVFETRYKKEPQSAIKFTVAVNKIEVENEGEVIDDFFDF